jgi:ribosomal protein L11 methyltransferase
MDYTEVRFYNDVSLNEAIIAWLGENDFDMFEERNDGVNAYIDSKLFKAENLKSILASIPGSEQNIRFETSFIKDQNWNVKWESNFEPVSIGKQVYIRAPFHATQPEFQYEIIIEPKMSFGTGHHATTSLMIRMMLDVDFKNKRVLDMGCGTGILSILADKLGASNVMAIDIEEWAYKNSLENIEQNHATNVEVHRGDAALLRGKSFDFILANINRNILLSDMPFYSASLKSGGGILLSGILTEDKKVISERASDCDLKYINEANENNWLAIHFIKE